jgi:cation diffusion facilitator family transporter
MRDHEHEPRDEGHGHLHHDDHGHDHEQDHGHIHGGLIDPAILSNEQGLRAIQLSFAVLFITTLLQLVVVFLSGSVALFADAIHNLGDAFTAIPLGAAFVLERRKPTKHFTYGYGRVEDLAGVAVVLTVLASAIVAGYESIERLVYPREVHYLMAIAVASLIGFAGNEAVAVFRIRTGKQIGSAALIADGYHARTDGLTSLSVLLSAVGVGVGFPMADPIIGLVMTGLILKIVWESAAAVLTRLLDGVDPRVVDEIREVAAHVEGAARVIDVRLRWFGHRLHAELSVAVDPKISVQAGHEIAMNVRHELLHHVPFLSGVSIHVDPTTAAGEAHHPLPAHDHDGLGMHVHH